MTVPSALAILVLTAGGTAAEAKHLEHRAEVAFKGGDPKTALADAIQAYKLDPQPPYILAIAEYQQALGRWSSAAAAYREYLTRLPDAPNKQRVVGLLAKAEAHRAESAPAVADLPSVPLVESKPPPLVSTDGQPLVPSTPDAAVGVEAPEESRQHSHFLALSLAGAGVVAAAFAVVGFAELASYDGYASGLRPGTTSYATVEGRFQTAQTWNVVAIVCTVAAAAGATAAILTW